MVECEQCQEWYGTCPPHAPALAVPLWPVASCLSAWRRDAPGAERRGVVRRFHPECLNKERADVEGDTLFSCDECEAAHPANADRGESGGSAPSSKRARVT